MFCITCGNKLEDGAKFCTHCGTRIVYAPGVYAPGADAPSAQSQEQPPVAEPVATEVPAPQMQDFFSEPEIQEPAREVEEVVEEAQTVMEEAAEPLPEETFASSVFESIPEILSGETQVLSPEQLQMPEPVPPVYSQPTYQLPEVPQYSQPTYQQPQASQYNQPTYQQPQAPQYNQPAYQQPKVPQYNQSTYQQQAPYVQAPDVQAPDVPAPNVPKQKTVSKKSMQAFYGIALVFPIAMAVLWFLKSWLGTMSFYDVYKAAGEADSTFTIVGYVSIGVLALNIILLLLPTLGIGAKGHGLAVLALILTIIAIVSGGYILYQYLDAGYTFADVPILVWAYFGVAVLGIVFDFVIVGRKGAIR